MPDISYDTLTIQINAESKVATRNINALNRGLKNLDQTAKDLDKDKIEEVKGLLLDIANIDFSNVSKGLQDIVSAFKAFNSKAFMKATNGATNLSGARQGRISTYEGTQLPDFEAFNQADIQGFSSFVKDLEEATSLSKDLQYNFDGFFNVIQSGLTPLEQLGQKLDEMGLNGKQTQAVLNSINYETDRFSPEQLEQLSQALIEVGYSADQAKEILSRLKTEIDENDQSSKKAGRSFGKMFANIVRYRLVRKIIQQIFQEIMNAMEELASIDKDFDQALGSIKSSFSYVARVLASVIAPVIKAIAPVIVILAQSVASVANTLASALSGALGQNQFAEAQEDVESYTESLKKAQKTALGIDELNMISQEDTGKYDMKDAMQMNGALGQLFATLQDKIGKLVEDLNPQLFGLMVKIVEVIEALVPILDTILDLVIDFVLYTDDSVNGSIRETLILVANILKLIAPILTLLTPILKVLNLISAVVLNIINWTIEFVSVSLAHAFDILGTFFATIVALFNFDFMQIGELWVGLLNRMGKRWEDFGKDIGNFFIKIWNGIVGFFEKSINTIINSANKVLNAFNINGVSNVNFDGAKIPTFAMGGFPEDGFFFANSGELIGKFDNGKTAVANNEQIIQGIKQGVMEAMAQGNNGGKVVVMIDSKEVATAVENRMNNRGAILGFGGNIVYGK